MKVTNVKIGQIKPYEGNPRNITEEAVEKVANSIKEFGFQQPIVVDKNNIIIVGHTRLKAAKSLGLTEVPVIVADNLSDEQVKAYRLADNKTGELTWWDYDLLFDEIDSIPSFNMEDFGFTDMDSDIEGLIDDEFNSSTDLPPDFFNMTFTFPIKEKEDLTSFVKDKGKDELVSLIMRFVQEAKGKDDKQE